MINETENRLFFLFNKATNGLIFLLTSIFNIFYLYTICMNE